MNELCLGIASVYALLVIVSFIAELIRKGADYDR